MGLQTDIATVLLLHQTSLFAGAMAFLHLWSQSGNSRGLGVLCIAFLTLGLGAWLAGLGELVVLPAWVWQYASLLLGVSGYAMMWLGIRALSGLPRLSGAWLILLVPVIWLAVAFATDFPADNRLRAGAFHLTAAVFLAASSWDVIAGHRREPLPSRKVLAIILGLASTVFAVRFVALAAGQVVVADISAGFLIQIFCNFGVAILAYGLAMERAEARLRIAADTDFLTGAGNRRWLMSRLPETIQQGDAVVAMDLDHFKLVNDRFGHSVGDHVLAKFVETVTTNLRKSDALARLGGEEFVIYLPGLSLEQATAFAERVRREIEALEIFQAGCPIPVTVSLGVAWSGRPQPRGELLNLADEALYEAKRSGRNKVIALQTAMTNGSAAMPPHSAFAKERTGTTPAFSRDSRSYAENAMVFRAEDERPHR
nr:GGDEF domain-containing protein [uncultured Devosia sp.]